MKPVIAGEQFEVRLERMGYELVELEWAGHRGRPIVRLRIDRIDATPGEGVTVDECARVSRALEPWLDGHPELSDRYVLEVSSPGVERPLVRRRDWDRFSGRLVAVRSEEPMLGKATYLEGELLGVAGESGSEQVRLRLVSGEVVEIPRDRITRAHLKFRFE